MALTIRNIAKNRQQPVPEGRSLRYRDDGAGSVKGLYMQVAGPKSATWGLRYQRAGKERWMGLGSLSDFTLDEARQLAIAARKLVKTGVDPIDARKAESARKLTEAAEAEAMSVTFAQCAERYYKFHSPHWKNAKHKAQFLSSLESYAYPVIGALPVGAVTLPMVLKVLLPIWQTKNQTASRVRNRIESVLDYAKVNQWRADTGTNPAAWVGNLKQALPAPADVAKVKHHPALSYDEMHEFMELLRQRQGVGVAALQFTILTAARSGDTIGARWDEIELRAIPVTTRDAEGKESIISGPCWIIPAHRMKRDKPHAVPLTDRAVEILKALPREQGNPFVFIGASKGKPISNMGMDDALKRMKWPSRATVHGFRSTFRDWASEVGSFDGAVVETALHHAVGDATERAYRRGDLFDKRRLLMDAWAKWCSVPKPTGDVVQLRGRKYTSTQRKSLSVTSRVS